MNCRFNNDLYTYVYTYIHTCTDDVFDQPTVLLAKSVGLINDLYTYAYIYIHTYIHKYIYVQMICRFNNDLYTYVYTYIHTCTDDVFDQPTVLLAKSVGFTDLYTYVYTYIHTYIHTYIRICTDDL